jgi:CheY-like chemotaxis protein
MRKLLVVDDDPDIRLLLQRFLEAHQFAVATAANGREAVECVTAEVPDGIFLDVRMPVMDGFHALDAIRREHPTLPIIMISASRIGDMAETVRARGASGYLPKPIDVHQLRATLRDSFGWTP